MLEYWQMVVKRPVDDEEAYLVGASNSRTLSDATHGQGQCRRIDTAVIPETVACVKRREERVRVN